MAEKYEQLFVSSSTVEPFVLCLALGTLEAMKSAIWSSEAGIWTIGRPIFFQRLEELKLSEETLNLIVQFDELNALEKFSGREDFERELEKIESKIKARLADFSENYWYASWTNEVL